MHSIIYLHNDIAIIYIFVISYIHHRIPNTDIVENFLLVLIERNNHHFSERCLNILLIQMSTLLDIDDSEIFIYILVNISI